MRSRYIMAGAAALAFALSSPTQTKAAYTNADGIIISNGVVVITTRTAIDAFWRQQSSSSLWDGDDGKGPGDFSHGDAAMGELLQDYGYSVRMLPEKALNYATVDWLSNPSWPPTYLQGGGGPSSSTSNVLWSAMLVIMSGSGSSADMVPPNTNAIPIIAGEHSVLGDVTGAPGSHAEIFLYGNKSSGNLTSPSANGLYMRVLQPNHPIMQGIPLDSQGRVKIFRDPYPEETAHKDPSNSKSNYEISWTAVDISAGKSVPAQDLQIVGVLDTATNQVVFATMEAGGQFGPNVNTSDANSPWLGYTAAPSRLVHFFVNEGGSGNSRRAFNALTALGRVIFIRTCKWAMGETLAPYQGLGVIDVGLVSPGNVQLSWSKLNDKNYRIDGTIDFVNWVPLADSITNPAGPTVSRTLNIASAPQAVFMRVAALP